MQLLPKLKDPLTIITGATSENHKHATVANNNLN